MALTLCPLIFVSATLAAGTNTLMLKGPAEPNTLGQYFEYTIDPAWQLTVKEFVEPVSLDLKPLPSLVPDFGYTSAKIWLKLPVANTTAATGNWRFFIHANFLQATSVYKIGADGSITTLLDLTVDSPFGDRPVDYPFMVAPFDLAPGETATLVVSYYSQGSSRLSMSIETPDSFVARTRVDQAKHFAFYGMMLVMLVLALVALGVLRQFVFAAYAAFVVSILTYIAHGDGAAFQYLWPDFPRFNSMASVVTGTGIMVFGGLFAISFLQLRQYHPVMYRIVAAVIIAVLVIDAVLLWTNPQLLKRLLILMNSVTTLTFFTAGLVAARKRFREVRFYVLAWFGGLIPAALFTARAAFGFEPSFITAYDAVRLALVFDSLMMGLAIFDRYNFQRQSAVEESLAQAQKNLSLSQRLGVLEGQYEQVKSNSQKREDSVKDTIHDLRQPMQALRLSLRQMFDPAADKANDAGQIESALAYMERLVGGRLAENADEKETGKTKTQHDTAHMREAGGQPRLHEVLRGIADMFGAEAAAKGLELKLVLAAPDASVEAYPLMRVVANLTSNAIKYTKAGRIIIALRRHGTGHLIEVHDTGPGLAGEAFTEALRRNQRLDRDLDSAGGSGLGLAVVTEIAAANQWTVTSCGHRRTGASIRVAI